MNLLTALMQMLGWPPPAVNPRPRRLRATCEVCGKDLAVVRTTGRLWSHRCVPPAKAVSS